MTTTLMLPGARMHHVFGLCLCLLVNCFLALAAGFARTSAAAWHTPRPGWALQQLEWAKRTQPSTAWRTVAADGEGAAPKIDWQVLGATGAWARAEWRLSRDWNGADGVVGAVGRGDAEAGLSLPALPDGSWWLQLKVFDAAGGLLKTERYFINVWNSAVQAEPASAGGEGSGSWTTAIFRDGELVVAKNGAGESAATDLGVEVQVREFDGKVLGDRPLSLVSNEGGALRWSTSVPEATPGRTLRLIIRVKQGDRLVDGDELWVATPGVSSPAPRWKPADGVPALREIFTGETINSFLPFEVQRRGLEIQLAGLRERGGGAVQLWIQWGRIETIPGAYDWENLDAYVAFLTERRIPFTLASAGSVLFGNGPLNTWGDWMLNHEGRFKLWRNLPVISPASIEWRRGAAEFTRRMVARYRGNPWLRGYTFIAQGMDSAIFTDHHDSVTDYSPVARADFERYLRGKYKTIDDLNAAWGTALGAWSEARMPMPDLKAEVNLSVPWLDFTEWKLAAYRESTVDVFDPVIAELDPRRTVLHYVVKTGPFEHLLKGGKPMPWGGADGAGEDHRMGRINALAHNWGLLRQTESHNVPPANLHHMMDMVSQTLRGEAAHVRFNLVWNSQASQFERNYPANAELQKNVRWWAETAPLRRRLAHAQPEPAELGVVLSWSDMLYRLRAWRWYTMPGNRADKLVRAAGFQPVRWLSEWAPDGAWEGLRTVLVPDDARVWDAALVKQLRRHVAEGGRLVVWGGAGRYSVAGGPDAKPFGWADELGAVGLRASVSTSLSLNGVKLETVADASGSNVAITRDERGRTVVASWPYGEGRVHWCLVEDADTSESTVVKLLSETGVPTRVSSSAPEIEGVLRKDGSRRLLVLSRFMGFGKKPDPVPLEARIGLPGMEGEWTVRRLLPETDANTGDVPTWEEFREGRAKVGLRSSEMQVFEFSPVAREVVEKGATAKPRHRG
jgi:Beta-galactosidase